MPYKNAEDKKMYNRKYYRQNVVKILLHVARKRANKAGVDFNLTEEDILIPNECPVLGIPIIVGQGKDNSPSLDRHVPELGYTKGNVTVISMRANRIRNDSKVEELERILEYAKRVTKRGDI